MILFFTRRVVYTTLFILLALFMLTACAKQAAEPSIYARPTSEKGQGQLDLRAITSDEWRPVEVETLLSLWLGSLPPLPPDPTNSVADNPKAAALGHRLFFDRSLSANNQIACATCHIPDRFFTDGLPTAHGTRPNPSNTPTVVGAGYAPWLFWNGRNDSLWSQAVAPFEAADEHGYTRLHAIHKVANDAIYRAQYEDLFGPLPEALADYGRFPDSGGPVAYEDYRSRWEQMSREDQAIATQIFINLGKSLAAYERLLNPGPAPFDAYVAAVVAGDKATMDAAMSADAVAGLRLFMGKGSCIQCHNGPLFSDFQFHNTGVPAANGQPAVAGRALGWQRLLNNEFNCASIYSEGDNEACAQKLTRTEDEDALLGALRTPMLRNSAESAPYMHAGQFVTLPQVLAHYNEAPVAPLGTTELRPLNLTPEEEMQLIAFLNSLTGTIDAPEELLVAPP